MPANQLFIKNIPSRACHSLIVFLMNALFVNQEFFIFKSLFYFFSLALTYFILEFHLLKCEGGVQGKITHRNKRINSQTPDK